MRGWTILFVVAACGKSGSENKPAEDPDCALISASPAEAPKKLGEKYPGAPVKVTEIIERCVAPTGEPCERMAKIWAAIPSMMPGAAIGDRAAAIPQERALELCKGMPPEMQRCMLPSYVGGHTAECGKVLADMTSVSAIDIQPRGSGATPTEPPCAEVAIELTTDEIRVGRGDTREELKHDWAALEASLAKLAATCVGDAALRADDDVTYEDMITAMDVAHKAGFTNIGLGGAGSEDDDEVAVPRQPPASGPEALKTAPVIVVTTTEVLLDQKSIAKIGDDKLGGALTAALKALPPPPSGKFQGLAIVQADKRASGATINTIVSAAKRAGFDNLLFAVKR